MKNAKFRSRFIQESVDFSNDRDAIDMDKSSSVMSDEPDISDKTIADVKRMFQSGDLDYDTLLKFLLDHEEDATDDISDIERDDDQMDVRESAPPGEEGWVKKMKPEFTRRYGKKKGTSMLYSTAWKRHSAVKEAWEDDGDDELSNAERELIAKTDKELKRRGVKVDDFDPDDIEVKAPTKPRAKQSTDADAKNNAKSKASDKKSGEPTRSRGKPIGERGGSLRNWFKENPNASRKEFMNKASEMGMGANHANTLYYSIKRKVGECFFIGMDGKYLTENSSLLSPKFIDLSDRGELLVFEHKRDAYRMVDVLRAAGKAVSVV